MFQNPFKQCADNIGPVDPSSRPPQTHLSTPSLVIVGGEPRRDNPILGLAINVNQPLGHLQPEWGDV